MKIEPFYDTRTNTLTYVVFDPQTKDAVVIDPVLDYEPASSKIWTESVDRILSFFKEQNLRLHYIAETHAHADHLSGAQRLKNAYPDAKIAVGERIQVVQKTFKAVFELPEDFPTDGRQFDHLLRDGEELHGGSIVLKTIFTPGHTPACVAFLCDDAVFTGDALFMPDQGTGRCDFPAGSAEDLYDSITKRLYSLPEQTRVFVGHDYQPGGRELKYESTIRKQKETNVQLPMDRSKEEFLSFRKQRDEALQPPRLLFQSVQVNVDAGQLPEGGYLKIPLNVFRPKESGIIEVCNVHKKVE